MVLVLLTALVTAVAVSWAVLTPPFRAPDEAQHLNSVVRLAHGGGWPAPGQATMAPAVLRAQVQAAVTTDLPGRYHDRPDRAQFVDVAPPPVAERSRVGVPTPPPGTPVAVSTTDQMTQHPPLYYAVAAAFLRLTGLADARWDLQLLALRLLSVVLVLPVVPLAATAARRLTGSAAAGLVAASLVLFAPQVGHVLGSVTNDSLMALTGAVTVWLCVRVLTGDLRYRTAAVLGLTLGLGLLTKVMAGLALPVVVAAYLLAPGERGLGARLGRVASALGIAFVVGGWWWLRNIVVHGTVQPDGMGQRFEDREPGGAWEFWSTAVWRLLRSSVGDLGWLELRAPTPYVVAAGVACVALCVVPLIVPGLRRRAAVLLGFPALVALTVLVNAWSFYEAHGWYAGIQGRYLFGATVAVAAVAATGAWTCLRRSERRTAAVLPLVVLAGLVVAIGGLCFGLVTMYRGPGDSVADALVRWEAWSPLGGAGLGIAVAAVPVVGLAAVLAAALLRGRPERAGDGGPGLVSAGPGPAGS
ncbi:DUF2142 domain-containing protein [Antribacter gilvus]|uniref:DUF2142 domain-containing protein n=1 Tax=Antribacter gilvus TaxID=2304675 RepID=UPI0013E01EBD|nr:DUF2142 domain-containing protein [Antribacter gilvus]